MAVNPDLLYAATHEWVRIEQGGEAVIGITDFAQDQLGDLTFVEMPAVGAEVRPGKEMGAVESVKAASDIYSPVEGTVVAVNEALMDTPELVNQSPYGEGWMVRVKLSAAPAGDLLTPEQYEALIAQ